MRGRPLRVVHARPTIPDPFGRGSVPPLETADENDPTHRAAHSVAERLRAENEGLTVELALVDDDPADALVGLGCRCRAARGGLAGTGQLPRHAARLGQPRRPARGDRPGDRRARQRMTGPGDATGAMQVDTRPARRSRTRSDRQGRRSQAQPARHGAGGPPWAHASRNDAR